jgi:hypothetical protein
LSLPGGRRVHFDSEQRMAAYQWLTRNLGNQPDTFITLPGLNSLYVWTKRDPSPALNYPAWMALLDDARQLQAAQAVANDKQACAVVGLDLLNGPGQGQGRKGILARRIESQFSTIAKFAGYELMAKKGRGNASLVDCVHRPGANGDRLGHGYIMTLSPCPGVRIHRIAVYDPISGQPLGDSRPDSSPPTLRMAATVGGKQLFDASSEGALDLDQGAQVALDFPFEELSRAGRRMVVRLFDADDNWVASIPVVE